MMSSCNSTWIKSLTTGFPALLAELAPAAGGSVAGVRGAVRTGGSAPIRLHVSDAVRDITDGVVELEEAVNERLGFSPPSPAPVIARLKRINTVLDRVGTDPGLAAHVESETRRMARRLARTLGDPEQLVRIPGRCPGCASVSLRVFPERAVVMCINPVCRRVLEGEPA